MRRCTMQDMAFHSQHFEKISGPKLSIKIPDHASMRAARLFLRAQAVDKFFLPAASTLEIAHGEQRAPARISFC